MKFVKNIFASIRESLRRMVVSLKRNPSVIPMIVLAAAFVYYALNLTSISITTAVAQGSNMGLCEFCIMLFSMLAMVCLMNAFPRRKKPNVAMLVVYALMIVILLGASLYYKSTLTRIFPLNAIPENSGKEIAAAHTVMVVYPIMVAVAGALTALMPLYTKLLKMINTSVNIEENSGMGEIEITE